MPMKLHFGFVFRPDPAASGLGLLLYQRYSDTCCRKLHQVPQAFCKSLLLICGDLVVVADGFKIALELLCPIHHNSKPQRRRGNSRQFDARKKDPPGPQLTTQKVVAEGRAFVCPNHPCNNFIRYLPAALVVAEGARRYSEYLCCAFFCEPCTHSCRKCQICEPLVHGVPSLFMQE